MVIDEKELIQDLYPIMTEQVKKDFCDGLFDDHLLTLSNMSSGLARKTSLTESELLEVWVKYRIYRQVQKFYAKQPEMFSGFRKVNGKENIKKVLDLGGLFVSFQYGSHRFIPLEIRANAEEGDQSLYRVIDRATHNEERQDKDWNEIYMDNNVDECIPSTISTDKRLSSLMAGNDSLYFYLDGDAGYEEGSDPVLVNFLGNRIKTPGSILRLAVKLHKPVCFLLAEQDEQGRAVLTAYEPLWLHDKNLEDTMQMFYTIFEEELMNQPELWKKWDQPRKNWAKIKHKQKKSDPEIDVLNRWGTYGLNIQSGEIYQIASS
jgi:lauroyl/myristoyl acyltransferase